MNLIPIIMEKLSIIIHSHSPSFLICTNHSSTHLLSSSSTSKSSSRTWFSALQLVDSITLGHVMVETVLHGVDIEAKKKQVRGKYFVDPSPAKFYPLVISPFPPQVLHLMGDLRLAPPVDDKVRKVRTAPGDDLRYLINIFRLCGM